MTTFQENIIKCLSEVKGAGKFVTNGAVDFIFPELHIEGIGEIAFPVNEVQAKALINAAHKAPFGKGTQTILDKNVRSGWEINADKLLFSGTAWNKIIEKITKTIKPILGLEDCGIKPSLYKLLIYEPGDFFLPHQDSEKEKGMFGTLVVCLPSRFSGGELVVRFQGNEEAVDFSKDTKDNKFSYAAFYADCEHEVKPVTNGYKVCLVYNLIQESSEKKVSPKTISKSVNRLADIFKNEPEPAKQVPYIILLGHQYTPENFSEGSLKLDDGAKAEMLLAAAAKIGYYAKLCLVTSFKSGMPEIDYGFSFRYGEEVDEDAEMAEIYDESLYIEHWADNEIPSLDSIPFNEEDLITSFPLDEEEPIIKESEGYMGNYGPDLNYWYHYGAVAIWPHTINATFLRKQDTESILAWMSFFNRNPDQLTEDEREAILELMKNGLTENQRKNLNNFNAIAEWLILHNDQQFLLRLETSILKSYFVKIDASYWIDLIEFLGPENTNRIFNRVGDDISLPVLGKMLSILRLQLSGDKENALTSTLINKIPEYFSVLLLSENEKDFPPTESILSDLFAIEKKIPQNEEWINKLAGIITSYQKRDYINRVLIPAFTADLPLSSLQRKAMASCEQQLQLKADNEPLPPVDWSREFPEKSQFATTLQILKDFIESPFQSAMDFRKNQRERENLEYAINKSGVDLTTETIRKGSPHTLRITKTIASYHKKLKEWKEDVESLKKVKEALGR